MSSRHGTHHDHQSDQGDGHPHPHGLLDPSLVSTERGVWAVKWSFVGLLATALLQLVIVVLSGSVALLADTIHNFADAATAIPLWVAFAFARLAPTRRFPYGYGRVEDLAGVAIVLSGAFFVWWQKTWKRGAPTPPKPEAMAIPRQR